MANERYIVEQLSEHLIVVGQAVTPAMPPTADCNLYLIAGQEGILSVDAGAGTSFPFVVAALARYGYAHLPLSHVLLTHEHWDHAWGLAAFRQRGAAVACSERVAAGLPGMFDPSRDVTLVGGVQQVGEFSVEVVPTPGHTPSSTSFRIVVDGAMCLFTGDDITEDGGLGYAGSEGFSRADLLASLRRLAALPPAQRYLPGHMMAPSFSDDPSEVLARGIARGEAGLWADDWSTRKKRLASAVFEGYRAARRIVE